MTDTKDKNRKQKRAYLKVEFSFTLEEIDAVILARGGKPNAETREVIKSAIWSSLGAQVELDFADDFAHILTSEITGNDEDDFSDECDDGGW